MGIITAAPGLSRGLSEKVRAKRPVAGLALGRCQTVTAGMMALITMPAPTLQGEEAGGRRVLLLPPPPPGVMSHQHFLEDESRTASDSRGERPWSK